MTAADVITGARQKLADYVAQFPDASLFGTDVVTEARSITVDTDSGNYRISDAMMLVFINDGQREIVKRLPWLLYSTTGGAVSYSDCTSLSNALFTPARLKGALVDYVVHRCDSTQEGDKFNAVRVKAALERFNAALMTSPFRWYNIAMLTYLNSGTLDIWDNRPHLRIANDGTFNTYTAVSTSSDTIPSVTLCLPDIAKPAVIAYIVWQCLEWGQVSKETAVWSQRWMQEYQRLLGEL